MRLNVNEREGLRKRVLNLIPQMKKSEIVDHFVKEGLPNSTIYDTINRMRTTMQISDKKKTGRPSSWIGPMKAKLKRLANNRTGVSQRGLGQKFMVHHTTIGRQLTKMGILYRKREKTRKYTEKLRQKAQELSGKVANVIQAPY